MLPLTAQEIRRIRTLIDKHLFALQIRVFGPEASAAERLEIEALVREGILAPNAVGAIDPVQDAYLLGYMRPRLEEAGLDPLTATLQQVQDVIAERALPLGPFERASIAAARQSAGIYAVGLGDRLSGAVTAAIGQEDQALRARILDAIQTETGLTVERHESAGRLASTLAEITQDYGRDWDRLATTELQRVQENGAADGLRHEFGSDAMVAKIPNPDACESCRRIYLDERGRPRIMRLGDMIANGSNVGRKEAAWKATVDPLHPWCHCRIVLVPAGFAFNASWQLVPLAEAA